MGQFLRQAFSLLRGLFDKLQIGYIFVVVGVFLICYGLDHYHQARILSFNEVPEEVKLTTKTLDLPVEIIIPSIDINLPVEPGQIKNGVWLISASSATFLNTSALPGEGGNTVIYGHNKKVIFGNLPYLPIGQEITVKTQSGKEYKYIADQKFFVGPDRVDLVSPSDNEELTIYTCWGLFDSQRAVIKAKPVAKIS